MSNISDLALKGHFEQLKDKFSKKGMAKAGKKNETLLLALKKAVGTIEDMYDKYPQSLNEKNRSNYKSLIKTLNNNGSEYTGHPDIMERGGTSFEKKPMQKSGSEIKSIKKNRKAG